MATSRRPGWVFVALTAVGILISSTGCGALDLPGFLAGGGAGTARPPPPATPPPGPILDAPDSVFRVVAWSMAIVAGSLVLAFVAKLLNHSRTSSSNLSRPGAQRPRTNPVPPLATET